MLELNFALLPIPAMGNKKVLAVVEDLFFSVKINESAKRSGLPVEFVKSEFDATSQSTDGDLKAEVWGDGRSPAERLSTGQ